MENLKSKRNILLVSLVLIVVIGLVLFFVFKSCGESGTESASGDDSTGTNLNIQTFDPIVVSDGLQITLISNYSGVFLEDGSDDIVSSIMMIKLENTSEKDLQLARINVKYDNFTAEYEATNLPSGESVVLLEKNRRTFTEEKFISISAENVVFFEENMSVMEDVFETAGGEGFVELKNISNEDVEGTIYIFYKNKVQDVFYGGITYRATIEDSILSGESKRVLTQHFTDERTEIVQIVNVE